MKKVIVLILAMALLSCEQRFEQITEVSITGMENGYYYVDMGTSVMWATQNIGASIPNAYGTAYAWGEIETKDTFKVSNYAYYVSENEDTVLKYNTLELFGNVDNLTCIEAADDVAAQKWGGQWRMPTVQEFQELITTCQWTGVEYNGVQGIKVMASNGNVLFFPSGDGINKNITSKTWFSKIKPQTRSAVLGWSGTYWSSSLFEESPNMGYALEARINYVNIEDQMWALKSMEPRNRALGKGIRPVFSVEK